MQKNSYLYSRLMFLESNAGRLHGEKKKKRNKGNKKGRGRRSRET